MDLAQLLATLKDKQFRSDVGQGVTDAANRGVIGGLLGGPVDLLTMAMRPLGYKTEKPFMGSEYIGDKLQSMGAVSGNRNMIAEGLAGVALPMGAARLAPKVFAAEQAAVKNAMVPQKLNSQAGVLRMPARNDMSQPYLQNLISSQRYIDRDIVAKKIKNKDFTVRVTPEFELDGSLVKAITDGHHALLAAIKSGNKPEILEETARSNDRIGLLENGKIDDYLEAGYNDAPWYSYATGRDIF